MFELPDLVIELISEYLSYEDLLNLRLTCKKLKQYIDLKEFRRLNLFVQQRPNFYGLFYADEIISYPNSFRIDNFKIFSSFNFKKNFGQIQKLIIYLNKGNDDKSLNIRLNELNYFTQLVHLEINKANKIEGKLNLENLKVCLVASMEDSFFELDCPNLNALRIKICASPQLIMKENNLTYLYIGHYFDDNDYLFKICLSSKNLSKICFESLRDVKFLLEEIYQNRLNLRHLKQIELKNFGGSIENLDNMIYKLSAFLKYTSKNPIDFLINNELISLKQLIAISDLFHKVEEDGLGNFMQLLYCEGWKLLNENPTLLNCFLPNVHCIIVDQQVELDEKLMSKMKNVTSLDFKAHVDMDKKTFQIIFKTWPRISDLMLAPINNEFFKFDEIPKYFPQLKQLILYKGCEIDNFHFISNLKHLNNLQIHLYQLKKEDFNFIFENCEDLRGIWIDGKHQNVNFEIRVKNGQNSFELECCTSPYAPVMKINEYDFDSLNSLIDYYCVNNLFESEFIEDKFTKFIGTHW